MHPADRIRGSASRLLDGKRVVLGVTGSIAAVKAVELARELVRHGARVTAVMTREAQGILHPNALEFATGEPVVTGLTGQVEHVRDDGADLLLVAPATGNTVSKMALGIDDTPVTTYFTALADKSRAIVAPAMHDSMWGSPFLAENLDRLRRAGVAIVEPHFEEGKAKLADPEIVVEHVLRRLGPRSLAGRRVLVVNGSTIEPVDEMRVITNRSTGRMGAAIVEEAFRLGADVEHWFGHGHLDHVPRHVPTRRFVTVRDLIGLVEAHVRPGAFDAVLMPAAISDFGPAPAVGKVSSDLERVTIELAPLPKVVRVVRERHDGALVPFKAESGVTEKELVERARASIERHRAAFVVANDLRAVAPDETSVLLVDARDVTPLAGPKREVARAILVRLAANLKAGSGLSLGP